MPDSLQSVFSLPDISFVDNDTLEALTQRLINSYEAKYTELTGQAISLAKADPMRVAIYAAALELFQLEQYVDRAGKQDLLKYSYGEFLDNLAASRGVVRQQPSKATTTLRFTLSEVRAYAVSIPAGTRATNGNGVYFETSEYGEVPPGSLYADISAICTVEGIDGNDLVAGQVNILVDAVPYVESVTNTTGTEGGTDLEDDASLAERTFLAPSSYSVAGPDDAYAYWCRTYNTDLGSVRPTSPRPCEVEIYILMADGSIPGPEVISGLEEYLANNNIRPLTDKVTVKAPEAQKFSIDLTYWVNKSDSAAALTIQGEVTAAVNDFVKWQTTEIGKDINPSELIKRIVAAGAKRVEVRQPVFTPVTDTQVAQNTGENNIVYGGMEDD